jgi:hypothetical protein
MHLKKSTKKARHQIAELREEIRFKKLRLLEHRLKLQNKELSDRLKA